MFKSSANVFRTRQAIGDLLQVVHLHRNAVSRIGASSADTSSLEEIIKKGGVIPAAKRKAYSSILLSAALPDDDFNAFVVATALLLADRLQGGGGDDLYWNFEAFREHYLIADAPVRAAIMNGFRTLQLTGQGSVSAPLHAQTCFTRQEEDVYLILQSEAANELADIIRADPNPSEAGALWRSQGGESSPFAACVGFRYLYERPESIALSEPETALLIRWV